MGIKLKDITLKNILAYNQGTIRYKLYYSKRFRRLIRKHIREQIEFRIEVMDRSCYENGSCKLCGCKTTALQMANKACDKPCYPPMMDKGCWKDFLNHIMVGVKGAYWWCDLIKENGKIKYFIIKKNRINVNERTAK